MRAISASQLLRALADGVNPLTGEVIEEESFLHEGVIIRALYAALKAVESCRPIDTRRAHRSTPKAGSYWTCDEQDMILRNYDSGMSIEDLAKLVGRTEGAITSRLLKLGRFQT